MGKTMMNLNRVIKILITSDFLLQSGWGLIGSIFAIFLVRDIQGGTIAMVGFISTIYWISKSILQPFIAKYLDRDHSEKDDFIFLVVGMYVANLVPLGYVFSTQPWHIYILELIRGIAMACVIPTWSAIFTRHIDKGREAFSWSMESTSIGLATGLTAYLGSLIATFFGFKFVFVLVSLFGTLSSSALLMIKKDIFIKNRFSPTIPPREKPF
jgi:predicted MFS family arabinose efflux permease